MISTKIKFATLFVCCLLVMACTENKPIIPCLSCEDNTVPTEPNDVLKKVLMEEFTGVRCVNCPQAKTEIENLQSEGVFGNKLVVVSYHAGFFSRPYPQSNQDFQTSQGNEILSFLDEPIGFPSGVINRKKFSGEDDLQIEQFASWGGFVAQELEEPALLAINMETTFNVDNRVVNISVNLSPVQDISEDLNLSVLLIENEVADVQLTPDGIIDNYVQGHVFRTMISNTFGDPINEPLSAGQSISSIFSYTLPNEWRAENIKVIAFVHHRNPIKEVFQAEEIPLLE